MQSVTNANTPPLAAIVAAQAAAPIFAYDRAEPHRELLRNQRRYATLLAQFEEVAALFDGVGPDVVLQVPGRRLTLRLGEAVDSLYPVIRQALDEQLRDLEGEIVKAHLAVEQDAHYRATRPAPTPDEPEYYIPHILALCQPAAVAPAVVVGLSREQVAARETAAHARAEAAATLEQPTDRVARSQAARAIGAQYLWHVDFPTNFPQQLACLDLFRLTAELPDLLQELNGGRALDAHDYAYLADVLRAALAQGPTAPNRLLQERALAWVEATAHAGLLRA